MDGRDIVIRQSQLYSFEKRLAAPWDLFARILLSSPLLEDENGGLICSVNAPLLEDEHDRV
jgi:hypothetical protein